MKIDDYYIRHSYIDLSDEPVDKNREFLKELSKLPEVRIDLCQMLGLGSGTVAPDPDLTLDSFLSNIGDSAEITLRIDHGEVEYEVSQVFPNEPNVTKFASCYLYKPGPNFDALGQIFRKVYGRDDLIDF